MSLNRKAMLALIAVWLVHERTKRALEGHLGQLTPRNEPDPMPELFAMYRVGGERKNAIASVFNAKANPSNDGGLFEAAESILVLLDAEFQSNGGTLHYH